MNFDSRSSLKKTRKRFGQSKQRAITSAKKFYYDTKVNGLKDSNVGKWWREVKNLAGISDDSGQWYCQLIDGDVVDSILLLPCATGLTTFL